MEIVRIQGAPPKRTNVKVERPVLSNARAAPGFESHDAQSDKFLPATPGDVT